MKPDNVLSDINKVSYVFQPCTCILFKTHDPYILLESVLHVNYWVNKVAVTSEKSDVLNITAKGIVN